MHDLKVDGQVHLFDSFEGLSEPGQRDQACEDAKAAVAGLYASSLEQVQANLSRFSNVEFHKGYIPDCLRLSQDLTFRFVHIDVDLYQPIWDSAEYFYPKLNLGGIMLFDDYDFIRFPGAREAVDEFVSKRGLFLYVTPGGSAYIRKEMN